MEEVYLKLTPEEVRWPADVMRTHYTDFRLLDDATLSDHSCHEWDGSSRVLEVFLV